MKFETKVFWVMTHHLNKNFHSKKLDQAPLKTVMMSNSHNNNHGILRLHQGKVREFCFLEILGTLTVCIALTIIWITEVLLFAYI